MQYIDNKNCIEMDLRLGEKILIRKFIIFDRYIFR